VSARPILSRSGMDLIRIDVSDTGIGIPRQQQHKLFKEFSQTDGSVSRRFGGTGLGLVICKRLVEFMGGEIGVISEAGSGTTVWFTVVLPASSQPAPELPKIPQTSETFDRSKGKILLVDDLENNREIVSAYLQDGGYDVTPVGSGIEAISHLRAEHFDLVLMDIQMPEMDGVTATRAIREMGSPVKEIPIVAMTGNVLPQQIKSFLEAGMNDHVGKPIMRASLYHTLWRWLPRDAAPDRDTAPASPHLNRAQLEAFIGTVGSDRVEKTLRVFERQLRDSFNSDLMTSRREAHDLINAAGLLGFETLFRNVQALSNSVGESAETIALLNQCRQTRDAVVAIISETTLHPPAADSLRKAG
jgi:CheY-like chemotaxis protein